VRRWAAFLPAAPTGLFLLVVVALPALAVFTAAWTATGGASGFGAALSDPLNRQALANSLEQGAVSALAAGAVGYPVGVWLGRYTFRGASAIRSFLLLPFLLPSLVVVLGVQEMFGPAGVVGSADPLLGGLGTGFAGIVVVNVFFNAPMVALLTASAVEGSPQEQEDAVAVLGGSPSQAYREIWGPLSWIGAGAGMLLTFLLSALGFAAPLLVCGARCYTLEVRIWSLSQVYVLPGEAGMLALLTVLVLTVPTLLYLRQVELARRRVARRARPPRPFPWRARRNWPLLGYCLVFLSAVVALLGLLLVRSVVGPTGSSSFAGWQALFSPTATQRLGFSTSAAVVNSLAFAAGAAVIALMLAVGAAYTLQRRAGAAGLVGYLLFLPLLISPVLLAFGLATLWRPLLGGGSSTWLLIILSQATVALPFTVQSLRLALARLGPGPWEAARTLGRGPFDAHLDVELPRVRAGLVGAALFAFAIGLGEFTATFFLFLPAFATLPVELDRLDALRLGGAADALAALLLLVSAAVFVIVAWGGRRLEL
jgi:thiamine transport system permease protein